MVFCHLMTKEANNLQVQKNVWEYGKCLATNQGVSSVSVGLWPVFQRREEECSIAKQAVRLNEEVKQTCYIL